MTLGLDFSWGRPGAAAIVEAGFEFVFRYCPYPGDEGKGLTIEEVAEYRAADLAIAIVMERDAHRPLGGFNAGHWDALTFEQAIDALALPENMACYFAVDWDAQPGEYAQVAAYFEGAVSALGVQRVGAYGHPRILQYLRDQGLVTYTWQALGWAYNQHLVGRNVHQYDNGQFLNGAEVDYNEAFTEDFGQWAPDNGELSMLDRERLDRLEAYFNAGRYPVIASDGNAAALEAAIGGPPVIGQLYYLLGEQTLIYHHAQGNNVMLGLLQTQQYMAVLAASLDDHENDDVHGGSAGGSAELAKIREQLDIVVAGIDAMDAALDQAG